MLVIGLNAYHADAAACIVRDGMLLAAAEEERFTRVKHSSGFPVEALRWCLEVAGVAIGDVDHIAINRNPRANLGRKLVHVLSRTSGLSLVRDRLRNARRVGGIAADVARACGVDAASVTARIHNVGHHRAHMASSFLVSPFDDAAVVSVDGFGDFLSAAWGEGQGTRLSLRGEIGFPHSLGIFYLALTQYLGFPNYGDEYKVMGLAPYGSPRHMAEMRKLVRLGKQGRYSLDLDYFVHHTLGASMTWASGEPVIGKVYSDRLAGLLGPARDRDDALEQRHMDIAASAQAMYEDALFHLLDHVHQATGSTRLALAGGCAMNSVANGKIFERTAFRELYVQSAAGDAGGAIGAAFDTWHAVGDRQRRFVMDHAYWGPEFSPADMESTLAARSGELLAAGCEILRPGDEGELLDTVAAAIAEGKVIGWFQGRMEWGPRALGNRSILGDPRRADMKEILNLKIKRRESFRPFAPSILREATAEWFETDCDVPFMLQVFQVRAEKRPLIPAVTHVNGSGRLQTVSEVQNARYYRLIGRFFEATGVPMLLNTSFNENEPVVCRPAEALDCFLRTRMDMLALGDLIVRRVAR